jgi:23S rRNA (cytidine1920-2'-O)/16S rRNA (cytidine1409-2'-O)-methyltransferase
MPSDDSRTAKKQRIDLLLVERGLVETRERAKRLVMAGEIRVDGQVVDKPGKTVPGDARIDVARRMPYVSRGGVKLAAALDTFEIDVQGMQAVDIGASTGGFTDCLLQRGAAHIYAIDVGYGQIAWKLRNDERVTVLERTNARYLNRLPGGVRTDLAVIDASFISLSLIFPAALKLLTLDGQIVALVKPQFEAGREQVGKGGVVRDPRVHFQVLLDICNLATDLILGVGGICTSPLLGPAGNAEFLIWLRRGKPHAVDIDREIRLALLLADSLRHR